MKVEDIQKKIKTLENIRDIFIKNGILSESADESFQRICNDIDDLYENLIKSNPNSNQ